MDGYTKEEALAFIEAIRLNLDGKVGFKWFVERVSDLSAYIEAIATENERLRAFIDTAGLSGEYESFCATQASTAKGTGSSLSG